MFNKAKNIPQQYGLFNCRRGRQEGKEIHAYIYIYIGYKYTMKHKNTIPIRIFSVVSGLWYQLLGYYSETLPLTGRALGVTLTNQLLYTDSFSS